MVRIKDVRLVDCIWNARLWSKLEVYGLDEIEYIIVLCEFLNQGGHLIRVLWYLCSSWLNCNKSDRHVGEKLQGPSSDRQDKL